MLSARPRSPSSPSTQPSAVILAAAILAATAWAASASVPSMYVVDFLAPASWGTDINEQGVVVGERSIDTGCDPSCVEVPTEVGVWSGDTFAALPTLPQWIYIDVRGISAGGWVAGTASWSGDIRAIVWKPNGTGGYEIIELGDLPDTDYSEAVGIDDSDRVVGYSYRLSPTRYKGFVWSETEGLVDVVEHGFPDYVPLAVSSGGTVAYLWGWYQLDVPGVAYENTAPPSGFSGPGFYVAINDAGDQLRLLGPSSGESIYYPFRYYNTGEWQFLETGGHDLSPDIGSVTSDIDISVSLLHSGLIAPGPAQPAESLTDRLSPAYGDATAYEAGAMTENGQMVARLNIGLAPRLVRLVPAEPCAGSCLEVESLELLAQFVEDPNDPGRCTDVAYTHAVVDVRVVDENGDPVEQVNVAGRFLTVYRLDRAVEQMTDSDGRAHFEYQGAACTGAMTFLVTQALKPGYHFDRTVGTLQRWMIPVAAGPPTIFVDGFESGDTTAWSQTTP